MFKFYVTHQGLMILGAIILAYPLALFVPQIFIHLTFISDTFINLLKLCALPVILTSLIVTIGSIQSTYEFSQIARNSFVYIILADTIAVIIVLILFNVSDINYGINAHELLNSHTNIHPINSDIKLSQIFNYVFTDNIFSSLVKFDVLPIVIFAIFLGLVCAFNSDKAKPILILSTSIRDIFIIMLNQIILLAPLAIFVLIGSSISNSYMAGSLVVNILGLGKFIGLFFVALFLHFLWQTILVLILYRQLSFKQLLTQAVPICTTMFISSSSLVTLPIAMEKAKQLGGNKKVIDFMLPICASMNFASGMMYELAASLFFLHILGVHIGIVQQILLAIVCIATGMAVGGIPETSMVSFITVFNMVHIPLLAIGILLPLDRILDRIRGIVNIFGNTCGTLIVSKRKIDI